jgi:hypothetical protein
MHISHTLRKVSSTSYRMSQEVEKVDEKKEEVE